MRYDLKIKLCGVMLANAFFGACFVDGEAEKQAKWTELEKYGIARFQINLEPKHVITNSLAKASMEHDVETDRRWFCEVVSFSMSTNDVNAYESWMRRKTCLIEYAISSQETEASIESWRRLAMFLADMRAKLGNLNSKQFVQKHREEWKKSHRLSTMEDWAKWRNAYMRDRILRSAWSWAVIDTERAIERAARQMPPERRKLFMETIISKTKTVPKWYADMMVDGGTNAVKKVDGVAAP